MTKEEKDELEWSEIIDEQARKIKLFFIGLGIFLAVIIIAVILCYNLR